MTRLLRLEALEQRRLLTIQIAAWNTLNNPNDSSRDSAFRTVFEAMGTPDILALSETDNEEAGDNSIGRLEAILDSISPANYEHVVSTLDGGGDATGFLYNTSTVSLIETFQLSGFTHDPLRAKFRPAGTAGDADVYVYSVHLKAGSSSSDRARRLDEAELIRSNADALGEGANVIVTGDFNMRASTEAAYVEFASSGPGRVTDVANALGNWHDNNAFRSLHTQDPRPNGGRMDDRFDLQLSSDELYDGEALEFVSFDVFGNNGTHLLNEGIQSGTGAAPEVLDALVAASDHLPIIGTYEVVGQVIGDPNPDPVQPAPDPEPTPDPPASSSNAIVISEIMYNPSSSETSPGVAEWLELVNAGTTSANLSGWTLDDEDSTDWGVIPALTIPAGGTAILFDTAFASSADFRSSWSIPAEVPVVGIPWGNLANSPSPTSELLSLSDASGEEIDFVNYDDAFGWPSDNNASSIQLLDFNADNNVGSNWALSTLAVDGAKNPSGGLFLGSDVASPGIALGDLPDPEPTPNPEPTPGPISPPTGYAKTISVRGSSWGSSTYDAGSEEITDGESIPWTGINTIQIQYEGEVPESTSLTLHRIESGQPSLVSASLTDFTNGLATYSLNGLGTDGLTSGRYEINTIDAGSSETMQFNVVWASANRDAFVSFLDFSVLAQTFGQVANGGEAPLDADFNADGVVSFLDFSLLARNFGADFRP